MVESDSAKYRKSLILPNVRVSHLHPKEIFTDPVHTKTLL